MTLSESAPPDGVAVAIRRLHRPRHPQRQSDPAGRHSARGWASTSTSWTRSFAHPPKKRSSQRAEPRPTSAQPGPITTGGAGGRWENDGALKTAEPATRTRGRPLRPCAPVIVAGEAAGVRTALRPRGGCQARRAGVLESARERLGRRRRAGATRPVDFLGEIRHVRPNIRNIIGRWRRPRTRPHRRCLACGLPARGDQRPSTSGQPVGWGLDRHRPTVSGSFSSDARDPGRRDLGVDQRQPLEILHRGQTFQAGIGDRRRRPARASRRSPWLPTVSGLRRCTLVRDRSSTLRSSGWPRCAARLASVICGARQVQGSSRVLCSP